MNKLDNIKNFNPDNFNDSENEYDTDSETELSNSDLEYDNLTQSDFNSKNCQTLMTQNNRFKSKVKKYVKQNLELVNKLNDDKNKLIQENIYLKEKIEILFQKNYELIDINKKVIKSFESKNQLMYRIIGTFFTSTFFGMCYYYYRKINH